MSSQNNENREKIQIISIENEIKVTSLLILQTLKG